RTSASAEGDPEGFANHRRGGRNTFAETRKTGGQDMKATRLLAFAVGVGLTVLPAMRVHAAVCGNQVKDAGEDCDWSVPEGDPCSPNQCPFSPKAPLGVGSPAPTACNEGTCNSRHICDTTTLVDPCTLDNSCGSCVLDNTQPSGRRCDTSAPRPAGSPCVADSNKCTTDACDGSGTCVATPVHCAESSNV